MSSGKRRSSYPGLNLMDFKDAILTYLAPSYAIYLFTDASAEAAKLSAAHLFPTSALRQYTVHILYIVIIHVWKRVWRHQCFKFGT